MDERAYNQFRVDYSVVELEEKFKREEAKKATYDLYEMKNLSADELRKGYRVITGLDNDDEFTDEQIYQYLLEALKETDDDQ